MRTQNERAGALSVYDLVERWRARASDLERFSPGAAHAFTECADELDRTLEDWKNQPLKLRAAAAECGFSEHAIGRMVRAGRLQNVGRKGAPQVRRGDLPRKPARELDRPRGIDLSVGPERGEWKGRQEPEPRKEGR